LAKPSWKPSPAKLSLSWNILLVNVWFALVEALLLHCPSSHSELWTYFLHQYILNYLLEKKWLQIKVPCCGRHCTIEEDFLGL